MELTQSLFYKNGVNMFISKEESDAFLLNNCLGKKLYAHVIWNCNGVVEVVSTFTENHIKDVFEDFNGRVEDFMKVCRSCDTNSFWQRVDQEEIDPGCNFEIFIVKGDDWSYQINFVEVY
jgi:hypothetical protein